MLHFVLESCAEMGAREHLSILAYGFIFFIPLLLLYFLCLLIFLWLLHVMNHFKIIWFLAINLALKPKLLNLAFASTRISFN